VSGAASDAERLFQQPWPEGEHRFLQLGFVVDDLFAAAARWAEVFRVGPFHVMPRRESSCTFRGEPCTVDLQVAVAQAGPVQIELIREHSDGPSVFEGFRGARAGFHQLCTLTFDFDTTVGHYRSLGFEVVCELGRDQRVVFIDTFDEFGLYTEVVEATDAFVAAVGGISRTCAEWDGTDPVRILTRDGYRVP
jgi:glyoxalase/bleomycin resistance protein/dioxygenase superfamily protein